MLPHRAWGHWMVLWIWKQCESYAAAYAVLRSQPNWIPMGDFGVMCYTALSKTIIKTPNEGLSFGRLAVEFQEAVKLYWWWPNTLLRQFMFVFALICHPLYTPANVNSDSDVLSSLWAIAWFCCGLILACRVIDLPAEENHTLFMVYRS